jgi:hypothetical protein
MFGDRRGLLGRSHSCTDRWNSPTPERERIRWHYVVGCFFAGALMIAVAYWTEHRWAWQGVTPSVLVNAGTAFGLAGLLFLLERRFVTVVRQASAAAASQAADVVADRLEARTEALETRLGELDEQTARRVQAQREEQDRTVEALEVVSFDSVTRALQTAAGLRALRSDKAEVQASHDRDGLWLVFSWGREKLGADYYGEVHYDEAKLMIEALTDRVRVEVEWRADEAAPEVAARLIHELRSTGGWTGDDMLDWQLAVQNLQRTLDVAITSRRRDAGAWHLTDQLDRLLDDEWAITTAGIERRGHGMVLARSAFPVPNRALPGSRASDEVDSFSPTAPADVDPGLWSYLVREGKKRFPGWGFSHFGNSFAPSDSATPAWIAETDRAD